MSRKKIFWLFMILAVSQSLLASAKEPLPGKEVPAGGAATFASRLIKPGDTLKITVWKYSDLNANIIVGPDGYISYSFVGDILVAGKTAEDLRQIITQKLDQQYVANPKVDIQMEAQLSMIFVVGEVIKPGSYAYQPGLDPLKAVALAGGFTDFASFKALIIRRDASGKDLQIKADLKRLMKANPDRDQYLLQPGDMVVIKRSWL
jgi:polysaccharide export outer membrane protein